VALSRAPSSCPLVDVSLSLTSVVRGFHRLLARVGVLLQYILDTADPASASSATSAATAASSPSTDSDSNFEVTNESSVLAFGASVAPGGGFGGGASAGSGTAGTISSISGKTIYLKTPSGTTIKVDLTSATSLKKDLAVSRNSIRPGDTITVDGATHPTLPFQPTQKRMFMIHRYRQLSAVVVAAACIFAVAACGSSTSSPSTPAASAAGGAHSVGLKLTTSQRSCLKKRGVTLPTGGFGGRGGGGRFTGGRGGTPPQGAKFPAGGRRGGKGGVAPGAHGGFAHNSVQSAALKACGVSFGSGRGGGPGGPGGPGDTTAG
jgi:hypothetical protein